MTVEVEKIASSETGLAFTREVSRGVVDDTSPVWVEAYPNSYNNLGNTPKMATREPISRRRAKLKGSVVDFDPAGGYVEDLTQLALEHRAPNIFQARYRTKGGNGKGMTNDLTGLTAVATDGTGPAYSLGTDEGDKYFAGDLVYAEGFSTAGNNGLKPVTVVTNDFVRAAGLVNEASPPDGAYIRRVGFQFSSGDATIVAGGGTTLPKLHTTTKDLRQLGVFPGDWMYLGDNANAAYAFDDPENQGFARVYSVSQNDIFFDQTDGGDDGITEMSADTGTGKTIRVFFGESIRNEPAGGTYADKVFFQYERRLGNPRPDSAPDEVQSDYFGGAVINTFQINVPTGDKVTFEETILATTYETRDGTAGNEPKSEGEALVEGLDGEMFNTSTDFSRFRVGRAPIASGAGAGAAVAPLMAFVQTATFTLTNNASGDKAVGVKGSFDVTLGNFGGGGSLTAYFADIDALNVVADGDPATVNWAIVGQLGTRYAGLLLDYPYVTLGDTRPNPQNNQPVTMPVTLDAALHPVFEHVAVLVQFWYLPSMAA